MDLAFFGLSEPPFNPTPDPRFLHLTPGHQEALAQLLYGVEQKKGFILLTGEVGTGKTTLLKALLDRLDDTTAVAFVTHSMLGFEGILEYMLEDLGIGKPGESSSAQRLIALQHFLAERHRTGQNTVLIVDEAQDLEPRALEQIRLLSNFEASHEKILQIVLVGQPELRAKLDLPELRQLKQRIGLRCTLPALAAEQVRDYIRARLRVAGARDLSLFTTEAVARIGRYSAGIPRVVNMVCDHCLVFAYADQMRRIDPSVVEEAIKYLEGSDAPRAQGESLFRRWSMTPRRWAVLAASGVAAALAMLTATHSDFAWRMVDLGSDVVRSARSLLHL